MIKNKEVIISTEQSRGQGTYISPMRRVIQVFTKDGGLIAENDPCGSYTIETMMQFATFVKVFDTSENISMEEILAKWGEKYGRHRNDFINENEIIG